MRCPFCSGDPPLTEQRVETPHAIQTTFWFEGVPPGPMSDELGWDFGGVRGVPLAMTVQEKKKGGAVLTEHYCLTEGSTVFTLKSRVPLNKWERDALFGFMKDSLRINETRGRKRKLTIEDIRAALGQTPKASIRRLALDLGVTRETVRQIIKLDGKTLGQLQREAKETRDETEARSGKK